LSCQDFGNGWIFGAGLVKIQCLIVRANHKPEKKAKL